MSWLAVLFLACVGGSQPDGLPAEARAAQAELEAALAGGDVQAVSQAARAASAWRGQDPALDRALGDALANHLLRVDEGAALLQSVAAPDDPAWRAAARGAALRTGNRAWLAELVAPPAPDADDWKGLPLTHTVFDQVVTAARTDASVDLATLRRVLADCALLDARPRLGRRQVDLPLPDSLLATVQHLGASRTLVARTQLAMARSTRREQVWHCGTGWLVEGGTDTIPDPLPPNGVMLAVSDGHRSAWVELDPRPEGPWATVATDGKAAARWMLTAREVDLALAEGLDQDAALARALARHGDALFLAGEGWTGPPDQAVLPPE